MPPLGLPQIRTLVDTALGRPGFGYVPDLSDARVEDFRRLGLTAPFAGSISLEQHCGPVLNQGGTNSCVANAMLDAELTTLRGRYGVKAELGSRLMLYYLARAKDGWQKLDGGSRPAQALRAIAEYGIAPESAWPFATMNVNRKPPVKALFDARERRGLRGSYKIYDLGEDRVRAIRAALTSRRALVFGVEVCERFVQPQGDFTIEWAARGKPVGRHMMQVVGLRDSSAGPQILVKNSWGTGWRAGGYATLDRGYIDAGTDWICIDPEEPAR
jgi:hypothetical protein